MDEPTPDNCRISINWPQAVQLPAGEHRLCVCRNSTQWPHCDSQQGVPCQQAHGLNLRKPQFVWLCQCGKSVDIPFCDGNGHIETAKR